MSTTVAPASDANTDAPTPAFVWGPGRRAFSEFCGSISDMADDVRSPEALWKAMDSAFRRDPAYAIDMAQASSTAKSKQDARELVPTVALGV